jgi:branched-chain amino acid transport system ATP-binding protein
MHTMIADYSTSDPLLNVDSIGIRFGGLRAVSDFSLRLFDGDLQGLIGPNGAGKTTVFNLLTGVYCPDGGKIELAGVNVTGRKPFQITAAGMARTFQNIRLFAELSVLENVKVACHLHARQSLAGAILRSPFSVREEADIERRSLAILDRLGLQGVAGEPASSLPYGDQRRLEIARALATQPKVLLLDEPAAGMNPQEKLKLTQLIAQIREQFKVAVLLIEHDMKLVMSICEKITVLDHGEIIACGSADEVQCNPKVIEAYLGEPTEA